jgi:predicted dehydrogenase
MTNDVRAAVVGAGAIGSRLDAPDTIAPMTHAGGYRASGFSLVAFVDTDEAALSQGAGWGIAGYRDFDRMMEAERPDVLSLAVPSPARADLLRRALTYRPLAVVAEKPLTTSVRDAEDSVASYRSAGVPLLVNYSRRFIPAWRKLAGIEALSASIRYGKGIRHNGTHAIDLCRMLFGECRAIQALASRHDHWAEDPTVSAFLRFDRCGEVFLQGLDERCFTLFEVDIIAPEWRIVVDQDGHRLRRFELRDDAGIPPGRRLVEAAQEDTGAARAMLGLMRNLRDVLEGNEPWCSGEHALAAQRIAERLVP